MYDDGGAYHPNNPSVWQKAQGIKVVPGVSTRIWLAGQFLTGRATMPGFGLMPTPANVRASLAWADAIIAMDRADQLKK